jgi:hypothetical protein
MPQGGLPYGAQPDLLSWTVALKWVVLAGPPTAQDRECGAAVCDSDRRNGRYFAQSRHLPDGRTVKRIAALAVRVTTTTLWCAYHCCLPHHKNSCLKNLKPLNLSPCHPVILNIITGPNWNM